MILKAKELISFKSEKERKIVFALLGTVPLLLKVHPEEEFHFHQSQQKTHPEVFGRNRDFSSCCSKIINLTKNL